MANTQTSILIVDDDAALLATLARSLQLEGYTVHTAREDGAALRLMREQSVHAVLLDLQLPGIEGLELLRSMLSQYPGVPVVMISGVGTIPTAIEAVRQGASDFLEKPIDRDRLLITLARAIETSSLRSERSGLLDSLRARHQIIGSSSAIRQLREQINRAAPTDEKVLILGETGTGKELVAEALYTRSRRAARPFIKVNCVAIPRELIESELFGHRKGAFTGAVEHKPGKFKLADGGTLFLDEIGDMDVTVQAKLLRALQDGEIEPVGGRGPESVDVRVLAATNQLLEDKVADGSFRRDLYFRLKGIVLRIPPLRERIEDIKPLTENFLAEAAARNNRPLLELGEDALDVMLRYPWPGNVRELEQLAGWLSVFAAGPLIHESDVSLWINGNESPPSQASAARDFGQARQSFEREYFHTLLAKHQGNISAVAREAGLERSGLYRRLRALGIVE